MFALCQFYYFLLLIIFVTKRKIIFMLLFLLLGKTRHYQKIFFSNTIDLPTFCVFLHRVVFFRIYVEKKLWLKRVTSPFGRRNHLSFFVFDFYKTLYAKTPLLNIL
jgi:hypothetical protein